MSAGVSAAAVAPIHMIMLFETAEADGGAAAVFRTTYRRHESDTVT
jgi:hypothetical protein